SQTFFPASPPRNMDFQVESVTALPSDWTDTSMLAHQHLLMLALQISKWSQALREIHPVLRPGGWVQLGESKPKNLARRKSFRCTGASLNPASCMSTACARDIPALLEKVGFIDIQTEQRSVPLGGEDGAVNAINHMGVFQGLKTPILDVGDMR
ncbi:hypothetical protein DFH07DRAFT_737083, partial [Mycena maculata]